MSRTIGQSQWRKTRELHIPSFCINPAYELSMLLSQRHWRLLARWAPAACAQEGEESEGQQSQKVSSLSSLRGSAEGQQLRIPLVNTQQAIDRERFSL